MDSIDTFPGGLESLKHIPEGITMYITDAVTPNLVGVDIGCGMFVVPLGQVDIDLAKLDEIVHQYIPSGYNIHETPIQEFVQLSELKCVTAIDVHKANCAIGSLGGGNHFIEVDEDDDGYKYLVVHSGSRNLGVRVCQYYQKKAVSLCSSPFTDRNEIIQRLKAEGRANEIQSELSKIKPVSVPDGLAYITGETKGTT